MFARLFHHLGMGADIPKPIGPFQVGSIHFRVLGENGVLTQIFFPFKADQTEIETRRVKKAYRNGVIKGMSIFSSTPKFIFNLFLSHTPHPLPDIPNNSQSNKETLDKFPTVFFSHGLGGNCDIYTKTCMDIASFGFVVIAMEHEDGSGSHAKNWTGDLITYQRPPTQLKYTREEVIAFRAPFLKKREMEIKHTLEFFTSKHETNNIPNEIESILRIINCEELFLIGHSFGAASTVYALRNSPNQFLGGILLDLWPFPVAEVEKGVIDVPICSILSETFARNEESKFTDVLLKNSNRVFGNFYIPGSVHSSFSDTPYWLPSVLSKRLHLRGSIEPIVIQKAFIQTSVEFMKRVLESKQSKTTYSLHCLQDDILLENSYMQAF